MDTKDFTREFIGTDITVLSHSNSLYNNVEGIVIDETARTFKILSHGKLKTVPKATGKFMIKSERFSLKVSGNSILMRPEERLKNLRKIIKNENKGDYNN
jgi:ribonuclease P protein subunit POP4